MDATISLTPRHRLALTVVIMAVTLMQVLDTTIANVALPHMQASLGAAPDTISWVLTSYIIAAAIATPVTGWLEARIGRFALLLMAIAGFTLASMACGVANSLGTMVAARLIQGVFGAFIGPLAQAILIDIYPPALRPMAITIWGMGVMIGPILGPVIGGVLTDSYNWRWVFFINVPVGIVAFIGAFLLMPRARIARTSFDILGFGLLAVTLGSFQLMLDRGSQLDWFNSTEILLEGAIAIAFAWMFVIHTLTAKNPLIPKGLFRDRNFVVANIFMLIVLGLLLSSSALLPPMLQALLGYDTTQAGLLMVPRGIAMMFAMLIVGRLINKVDIRLLIAIGLVLVGYGQWIMKDFDLMMGNRLIIISGLLTGVGFGLVFMPLNIIAFATLPAQLRTNGAALYNLSRNIGGSIAIAIFSALLARNVQISHSNLAEHISITRFNVLSLGYLERAGLPSSAIFEFLDREINRQAAMIAYIDDFWVMALMCFAIIPLVFLLGRLRKTEVPAEAMAME